ncbi:MAG: amidohydrolase family protein [Saprospiraceae bacterium]|nr:amidohydrolase family protein [Saprospiraceae bacterium]MCB9317681.1 amidohydrolase family protein [Lewinellaceae bacterium]
MNRVPQIRRNPLWLGIVLLIWGCNTANVSYPDALCLQHIDVLDPETGIKKDQTVVIQNGKILRVADSKLLPLSSDNIIIDGTGKYLIPGLWDAHVHFAFMEDLAPSMFDLFLAYGITSVRDTGGKLSFVQQWRNLSRAKPTEAPRVMIAGPLIDGIPNVYDGSDPDHPPLSVGMHSVAEVHEEVQQLIDAGVDFLKAYEMLTPEEFYEITRMAQAHNLKVTGHVPLSMDVITASNAGLNSMEHLRNLELSCASNSDSLLNARRSMLTDGIHDPGGELRSRIHNAERENAINHYDEHRADSILQVLYKNQTWQIPTLNLASGNILQPFMLPDYQESFAYLPDTIAIEWMSEIEHFKDYQPTEFQKRYTQWFLDMVGKINQEQIPIMAGTDCPIFFQPPGRSLHQELVVLVKAGLTPLEAIRSATLNPARYFGMEKELGSVKENEWADLVVLDANPLDDINNTRKINAVIKQGKYYSREDLDHILDKLKQ